MLPQALGGCSWGCTAWLVLATRVSEVSESLPNQVGAALLGSPSTFGSMADRRAWPMTSPATLYWAGGLGFALFDIQIRPRPAWG